MRKDKQVPVNTHQAIKPSAQNQNRRPRIPSINHNVKERGAR
jgi:hypothetical protein